MLQKLRDQTQSLAFKVLVAILVVVLAIFGFGAFNLFVTGEPEVARVNGEGITETELAAATERERRRLAAQLGEDFDPSLIDPVRLQGNVLEQLIARRVLGQGAEDLGVAVSRARVDELLVSNPTFQIDGQFQSELYRQTVRAMGYTPQAFIDETTSMMVLQQLQSAIMDSSFLTARALNLHAGLLAQRRDIAYLPFAVDRFREQVQVEEDEVRLRYEENQRNYMTEEAVDVAYVTLRRADLADDPAVTVSEDEVRTAYEAERAEGPAEEERRSRHILLEVGDQRTVEEAVARLEEVRSRVAEGESFAELAREISEDPGSANDGGDLGFAGRGIYDPAFEEALFALEAPGDVSEPVVTDFGVHLIALEEVRRSEYPSFEEARGEIERRLREQQADALYQERLRDLDNLAFEQPDSLQGIADALHLEIQRVEGVTRDQGPAPLDDPEVRQRLFAGDVLERGFNSAAVELGDGRAVVMRVTERREPAPIPFEDVAPGIREEIETERARMLAQEAFEEARSRLLAGDSAADVARASGGNWQRFEAVRRNAPEVPRNVVEEAFSLPRPGANGRSVGEANLPGGGLALVTVTRVQEGDRAALPSAELDGMRSFLADRAARLEFSALFETLREAARISRADAG